MRIVQVSDLHVGPHTPKRYLAKVAMAVRDAQPDLIAVTGDQVDDYARGEPHTAATVGLTVRTAFSRSPAITMSTPGGPGFAAPRRQRHHRPRQRRRAVFTGVSGSGPSAPAHPAAVSWINFRPAWRRTSTGLCARRRRSFTIALGQYPAPWRRSLAAASLTLSGRSTTDSSRFPGKDGVSRRCFSTRDGMAERDGSLLFYHPGTNYGDCRFALELP